MARYVILDFGSHSFKALFVNTQLQNYTIEHQVSERNPLHNYDFVQEGNLLAHMRTWLDKQGDLLDHYTQVAILPGFFIYSRIFHFPFGKTKSLESVINMEFDEQLPLSHDELIIDFKPYLSSKTETHLLAAGVAKEPMRRFLTLFNEVGQDPPVVTFDASLHGGFCTLPAAADEEILGILDLGHRKSTFSVHYRHNPCFCRTLMIGGLHITASLSEHLGVSLEKAEEIKHKELLLPAENVTLAATQKVLLAHVQPTLEAIEQQIQFSLLAFEMKTRLKLRKVYLMGGSAKLKNIAPYLSAHFPYINFYPVTDLYPANLSPDELEWSECHAAVLSQNKKIKRHIFNFRKGEFSYRKNIEQLKQRLGQLAVIAAGLLIFPLADVSLKYILFKKQYEALHKQLISSVFRNFPDIEKEMKAKKEIPSRKLQDRLVAGKIDIQSKLTSINKIDGETSALLLLKQISEALPSDLTIDVFDLSISPTKIRISAYTDSVETRDKIVDKLRKSSVFQTVIPGPISNCTEGTCKKFIIDLEVAQKAS